MSSLIVEVCKIDHVEKHPNADALDIVQVKGWHCIARTEAGYKAGDLVVYIPPDSVMPEDLIEKYELAYLRGDGRVKSVKLRGYLSQGLLLPPKVGWKEGQDVAKELGIKKWEPPTAGFDPLKGKKLTDRNPNGYFDKYTSLENVKNYNNVFQVGDKIVITEKIHGTNFRAGRHPRLIRGWKDKVKAFFSKLIGKYDPFEFVYGSHNVQLTYANRENGNVSWYGEDVYGKISERYKLAEIIPDGYTIYGEIYGKGIQDLVYGLEDRIDLVVFDVKKDGKYLNFEEFRKFCTDLGLPMAPVLYIGDYYDGVIEEHTGGKSTMPNADKQIREGNVTKDYAENSHPRIGRKILKSISADYLLRKNGTEFH